MSDRTIVDVQAIGKYFSAKWRSASCPFCGRQEWDVACKKNGDLLVSSILGEYDQTTGNLVLDCGEYLDSPEGQEEELMTGEALVLIRCRNCSYVANFDLKGILDEVRKWKAQ